MLVAFQILGCILAWYYMEWNWDSIIELHFILLILCKEKDPTPWFRWKWNHFWSKTFNYLEDWFWFSQKWNWNGISKWFYFHYISFLGWTKQASSFSFFFFPVILFSEGWERWVAVGIFWKNKLIRLLIGWHNWFGWDLY